MSRFVNLCYFWGKYNVKLITHFAPLLNERHEKKVLIVHKLNIIGWIKS
jgi:hypothetical protein